MSIDIGPRIGLDGEADFRKSLANINQQIKTLGSEMKVVTSAFDANDKSQEALAAQNQVLTRQIGAQEQALAQLRQGLIAATVELGETDTKTLRWQQSVNKATAELNQMKTQLAANERAMDGLDGATGDVADAMDKAGNAAERSEGKFSAATVAIGSLMASAVQTAVSALADLVSSLVNLDEATEEYRIAQGKLNTAFEAAGFAPEAAKQAYTEFYKILGDTDTATEASQLLAKLARSEEDVASWTEIAAGVWGTFGDSLPIEGLIEAANETAKVGQVTGTLADALNWAGINEDEFNTRLAAAGSEAERNRLIMDTLSVTYDQASDAFYRNNAALVSARENQAALDETMSGLGATIGNIKTQILSQLVPSLSQLAGAFNSLLTGAPGAQQAMAQAIQGMVDTIVAQLPGFLNAGVQIITALASGIINSLPALVPAVAQIVPQIVTALAELLPQVLDIGMQILGQLATGIETGLPDMVSRLPSIIDEILNYITSRLPDVLASGVEIVNSIADGITDSIPILIKSLPQLITSITSFIAENLPKIVSAGADIVSNLAVGLVSALPTLVSNLPQIIGAIVTGLLNLKVGIIKAGAELIFGLWDGMESWLGELENHMPGVLKSVVSGIKSRFKMITDVGRYIIEGVVQGIDSAKNWLIGKVTGIFNDVVGGVKSFLGIASPSRLMRDEVGVMIPRGVAVGIDDGLKYVSRATRDMANELERGVKNVNASVISMQTDLQKQVSKGSLKTLNSFRSMGAEMASNIGSGFGNQIRQVSRNIDRSMSKLESRIIPMSATSGSTLSSKNNNWNIFVNSIANAIREALHGIAVYLNGEQVGIMISNSVATGINDGVKYVNRSTRNMANVLERGIKNVNTSVIAMQNNLQRQVSKGSLKTINGFRSIGAAMANGIGSGFGNEIRQVSQNIERSISELGKQTIPVSTTSYLNGQKVGVMIPRGVAVGIDNGLKYVSRATRDMANELERGVKNVNASVIAMQTDLQKQVSKGSLKALNSFRSMGAAMASNIGSGFGNQIRQVSRDIDRSMAELGSQSIPASASSANGMSGRNNSGTVFANSIASAVRDGLHGAAVYLNGQKVGYLITRAQNKTTVARGKSQLYL